VIISSPPPEELRDGVGISQTLVAAPRTERSDRLTEPEVEMGHQTPIEPHLEREVRWLSHEHSPYRQWEPAQPSLPDAKPSQSNSRFRIGTEANVMKSRDTGTRCTCPILTKLQ